MGAYFVCCDQLFEFIKAIAIGGGDFFGTKKSIIIKILLCIITTPLAIALLPIAFILDLILLPFWLFIWERH